MLQETPANLIEQARSAAPAIALGAAVPVLGAGFAWVSKFIKARYKKSSSEKGPEIETDPEGGGAHRPVDPGRLRGAWRRFLSRLPRDLARSLPNWEYFVVLGMDASGKDWLIDTMIDWPHYMRQLGDNSPPDPDLPVFLGPGAVIVDLPWGYWQDGGARCRSATAALWKRLFRRRGPTVVVTITPNWLREATNDELVQFAELARERVNQIAEIRRKPIEVRVAVTRMQDLTGFLVASHFWKKEQISNRFGVHSEDIAKTIQDWEQEMIAQLPRALGELSAEEYRRYVVFLRDRGGWLEPLQRFADTLFANDIMSEMPVRGGIYLCSEREMANPLRYAAEGGPGRDVRRPHWIASAAGSAAAASYLVTAFVAQHALVKQALTAWNDYRSLALSSEKRISERELRSSICDFALWRGASILAVPSFFERERGDVRRQFSRAIRTRVKHLLVERASSTASNLRWRRTVYYLGLLHSESSDLERRKHELLEVGLPLWAEMTSLSEDYISDFVDNTDNPDDELVEFNFPYEKGYDPRDTAEYWATLPAAIRRAVRSDSLSRKELEEIQKHAEHMKEDVARFHHDDKTLSILKQLGRRTGTAGLESGVKAAPDGKRAAPNRSQGAGAGLSDAATYGGAYQAKFRPCVQALDQMALKANEQSMRSLLDELRRTSLDVDLPAHPLLLDLADRLADEADHGNVCPSGCSSIQFRINDEDLSVDPKVWRQVVRSSRTALLMRDFLTKVDADSLFFSPQIEAGLKTEVWNPVIGNNFIFGGARMLDGRYTRSTYEEHIRQPIVYLASILSAFDSAERHDVLESAKAELESFVKNAVERYANAYVHEATTFLRSFAVQINSQAELRLAFEQISSDESMFDSFLKTLDKTTYLRGAESAADEPHKDAKPMVPAGAVDGGGQVRSPRGRGRRTIADPTPARHRRERRDARTPLGRPACLSP